MLTKANELPTHIFDVQEYVGGFFLETVASLMNQMRKHEMSHMFFEKLSTVDPGRSSMTAYLWGMKLAQFVKELESVELPEELEGYGRIINKDGKYQGEYQENKKIVD